MIMRLLLLCCQFVIPSCALAATWYVTNTGAGATDGTNYANAFAGWPDINMAGISAGDTLIICGTIASASQMSFTRAGTSGNPITITGICPEEGGRTGVLDGLTTATPNVLKLSEAGQDASFVNVQDLTVKNSLFSAGNNCILLSSLGGGVGGNVLSRLTIQHCGANGLAFQKANATLRDSIVSDTGDDGIGFSSAGIGTVFSGNTISNFSVLTTGGDGIACDTTTAGSITLRNNTVIFQNLNSVKQGIICGNNGTGTVLVEGNTVTAPTATTANHGISIVSGVSVVRANKVSGFLACVTAFTGTVVTLDIYGNQCTNSQYVVLMTLTLGTPAVNIFNNTGVNVTNGFRSTSTGLTITHSNNIYSLSPGSTGQALYTGAANTSYTGNKNIFYPEAAGYIQMSTGCSGTFSTIAAYKAGCPQDQASLSSDPLFQSSTDLRLQLLSPARGAGIWVPSCMDVRVRTCYQPFSIGAYQVGGGDIATTRATATTRGAASARSAATTRQARQ